MRCSSVTSAVLAAICASMASSNLVAQEEAGPPPKLTLEAISVEPASPGADTLCRLRVTLDNRGTDVASQLGFTVKINSQALPVYGNQLFMYPVEPGTSGEIQLYNFWSTETSRPMPQDGKLNVEVTLTTAQWMKITMEDDVEVWQPLGPIEGLPSSKSVTLTMRR